MWLYWTIYWLFRTAVSLYCRIEIHGLQNVPKTGPVLVAINHVSAWDPPVAAVLMPRSVYFMAKAELFEKPWKRWLFTRLHAFPVHRGHPDRKSLRQALKVLDQQEMLIIFPEGHRSETGTLQEARAGIVFLAQKTGVPVLPVGISGQYGFRKTIRYVFGPPFTIPREMDRHEAQQLVMQKIAEQIENYDPQKVPQKFINPSE
ncbi:MAG: lysophospholipid acyltransferase family protein [Firmicutes bacterium]|nr:lysophospholipid acyltransferase family protein [Bacillota bacterium]